MIELKSLSEIDILYSANQIIVEVMRALEEALVPGVKTIDLENIAVDIIKKKGAKPAFPTVPGYNHALCVSINEEVVHGIPCDRIVHEGDIVSIDCGVIYNGFFGDHAWSFPVGAMSTSQKKMLAIGEKSLKLGIEKAMPSGRLHDISNAIQSCAESEGYSIVRDFVGHGIGRHLHEEPQVPNYGKSGTGVRLRPGLVIALEPMLNGGTYEVEILNDGWTVVTKDRKPSVHFEHSIAILEDGPRILSQ